MPIGKIIVIQPHTTYVSLKREQVKQALLLAWAVTHDLRESMLKKQVHTTASALQQVYKILVKTEETASRFWAKHVGSQYPQKQLFLLCYVSKVWRIWLILILDRRLSSGKDKTGFFVSRNTITQYHKIRINYI